MKGYLLLLAICISATASTITLPDGRMYSVSDWTAPIPLKVPAADGAELEAVKRSTVIKEIDTVGASYPIDFLYEPTARQVWLSTPSDQYFVYGGRVYGARVVGRRILLRGSVLADAVQPEEKIMLEQLQSFLQDPMSDDDGPNTIMVDLESVFGSDCLQPRTAAMIPKAFRIGSVSVGGASFTVFAHTLTKNRIVVTIGDRFGVVAAKKNGHPVLLLSDGRRTRRDDSLTIFPSEKSFPSPDGSVTVISGGRVHSYKDETGVVHERAIRAAVNPTTGGVWFGPSDCKMAVFAGQIMGAMVDAESWELLIYREYGQMELSGNTADSFQTLLGSFYKVLSSGTFKEAARIPLARLPNIPRAENPAFGLRQVDVRDSQLRVLLRPPFPGKFLELRFDEDLNLVSATLRPPAPEDRNRP